MVLGAHSGIRYLILLVGIAVVLYAAYGLVTKRPYDKNMRILAAAFTGLIDLQILVGLATLFTGVFYPQLGGHIVMMVLAAVIAHAVSMVMKRRPPEQRTYAPYLVSTLIVLGMLAGGIMAIGRPVIG